MSFSVGTPPSSHNSFTGPRSLPRRVPLRGQVPGQDKRVCPAYPSPVKIEWGTPHPGLKGYPPVWEWMVNSPSRTGWGNSPPTPPPPPIQDWLCLDRLCCGCTPPTVSCRRTFSFYFVLILFSWPQ